MGSGSCSSLEPPGRRRTRKTKQAIERIRARVSFGLGLFSPMDTENESNQADRTISTGKLHALLHFHTRPINVVVFHGSQGNARFEVGFPLRCFQRLSRPYIAMQHCRWRDNCSTRGTFIPVLSYHFNRRTAEPLGPSPAPGCDEPTSRCQTTPSIWTLGRHQPVIPGVPFIR